MEKINRFLEIDSGWDDGSGPGWGGGSGPGWGWGDGSGSGDVSGSGRGDGSGSGDVSGSGRGDGSGLGSGDGWGGGWGDGSGSGDVSGLGSGGGSGPGWGDGSGSGDVSGSGRGDGIKTFNGNNVYMVDGVATIINNVIGNLAKGFVINNDLTTTPCYVIKGFGMFAHGSTAEEARDALEEKMFANMNTEQAIECFMKTFALNKSYPAREFYVWHNRLTGSCEMGRNQFVEEHNIDLDKDELTVWEFIELTKNAYGWNIIRRLAERLKERASQ